MEYGDKNIRFLVLSDVSEEKLTKKLNWFYEEENYPDILKIKYRQSSAFDVDQCVTTYSCFIMYVIEGGS